MTECQKKLFAACQAFCDSPSDETAGGVCKSVFTDMNVSDPAWNFAPATTGVCSVSGLTADDLANTAICAIGHPLVEISQ